MTSTELAQKPTDTIRVVVDAMGGDCAPDNEVAGTLAAVRNLPSNVEVVLVGRVADIEKCIAKTLPGNVTFIPAKDVVGMGDEPSSIVKHRKESSMYVGLDLVSQGLADAFVSGGNTGAVMATATMMLGRLPGVSRPTIGSFFPTSTGRPTLVVDVGANVDSKPRYLRDYAVMGSVYYGLMLNKPLPSVGLLNVGEESEKGTENARQAYALIGDSAVNFVGNVEGRDILRGTVDVVVCDGFEGNIVLKFAESVLPFLRKRFTDYAGKGPIQRLTVGMFRPILRSILAGLDYQEYGGVPLLGVNGVVIIGHGSSTSKAITQMIYRAVEMVQKDVNGTIKIALQSENKGIGEIS